MLVDLLDIKINVVYEYREVFIQVWKIPRPDFILFFLSVGEQRVMSDLRCDEAPVFDFGTTEDALKASLIFFELVQILGDFVLLLFVEHSALVDRIRAIALEGKPSVFRESFNPEITWRGWYVLVSVCAKFRLEDELECRLPRRSVEGACWCDDQSSPALPRVSISPLLRRHVRPQIPGKVLRIT